MRRDDDIVCVAFGAEAGECEASPGTRPSHSSGVSCLGARWPKGPRDLHSGCLTNNVAQNTLVSYHSRDWRSAFVLSRDTVVETELNGGGEDVRVWPGSCWVEGLD